MNLLSLLWIICLIATKGYVVLDDASFPIIGEGTTEPNDNFITQLVDNAEAAINAVDALGYINRKKSRWRTFLWCLWWLIY
jgi:hypothetical protein